MRVFPLLNDVLCCFGTSKVLVSMFDLGWIFVRKPVLFDQIDFLISKLS
jgi:hypothetical protein